MPNSDKKRKLLYIILPIATVAVIAAIIIPMIILNRPQPKPAPEKFLNDVEAYAFVAVSSSKLISDESFDELDIAKKYLAALDGFWDNAEYDVTSGNNADASVPYHTKATVSGAYFDGADYSYTLFYTETVKSSSELKPSDGVAAPPAEPSPAEKKPVEYKLRGVLPIGGKAYTLAGERSPESEDKRLTVTVTDGEYTVACTRTFECDLDFDSGTDGSFVMPSSAAVVKSVPIFYYSISKNGAEIERAKLMLYSEGGFSLIVKQGDATYKYTAYRFTESAMMTVADGTKYDIEKSNGKYELKESEQ